MFETFINVIKSNIPWVKSFFEDNTGGNSTIRAVTFLWMLVLSFVVIFSTIKKYPIDNSMVILTTIVISGKVVQRFGEKE